MKAIVIGAGFGGIAAALRLRAKGYEVSLIDRCAAIGGRAQVFERNGFKHDAGPTVITAPFLFEELFALFWERLEDHVRLVPLKPWYRFHFADNTQFDYGGTLEETLAEIARIEPGDCDGYRKLLARSEKMFDVGFLQLSAAPFHRFGAMVKQIPALLRLRSHDTVWQLVCRHLKNPKLRQAFSIQPLLVGGNPFDTTSIYGLIHYLERAHGVHFAMGGTAAITAALGGLMDRQGIKVKLNTTVSRVNVEEGIATGVTLSDGLTMAADVIVSDADPAHLYGSMIRPESQAVSARLKLATAEFSMGLFVLYFGTTRQYPDVAHHTIWLGERYRELLADIFHDKILSEDFSLYLHRPTATDPSFAPTGCDSFYVLCPVPNLKGAVDWAVEGPRLQTRIVAALAKTILPGLHACITSDFYMTPENFRDDYLSAHGAGFSVAPLFRQSAWFRFHNRAEGVRHLYLVGAGTHPGAGLPGVLCSAKVMDALVPAVPIPARHGAAPSPANALQSADLVLSSKGKSFHWSRRWMAPAHAARATRLYGFCRYVDDLADEGCVGQDPRAALALVAQSITSGRSENPIVADAIALMSECHIPRSLILTFIDGITSDLDTVRIADEGELIRYCYQAAGTVGAMMCRMMGCDDPAALRHAIDLGIAMQLTNICRDVAADAADGRRYLPASMIGDLAPQALVDPAPSLQPRLQACIGQLLDTADRYYLSGEAGLAYLPMGARCSILVAARVYRAIGTRLRQRGGTYWLGRTVVPRRVKGLVTLQALLSSPLRPPFWVPPRSHDHALHAALSRFLCAEAVPERSVSEDFDLVILGGGCAGLSLALALAEHGERCPRTLVIEPRSEYTNDRTWCCWSDRSPSTQHPVQHSWQSMRLVHGSESVSLDCGTMPYQMLAAQDFYAMAQRAMAHQPKIELRQGASVLGEPVRSGDGWRVQSSAGEVTARSVVDTRPSQRPRQGGAVLWQSFYGQEIECSAAVFDPSSLDLMNFLAPDPRHVAFVYVLPISLTRALVEVTVFGAVPLERGELAAWLDAAIAERVGVAPFNTLRCEHGILPMGLIDAPTQAHPSCVKVGVTAGGARASTGYAYQRIQQWASECASALVSQGRPVAHRPDPWPMRWMDRIFLEVLRSDPSRGASIFFALFSRTETAHVIRFLSGRAGVVDSLHIIAAMPVAPFVRAAIALARRRGRVSASGIKGTA